MFLEISMGHLLSIDLREIDDIRRIYCATLFLISGANLDGMSPYFLC